MNITSVPLTVAAGTSVVYRRVVANLPPQGWSYLLALSVPGFAPVTATVDGDAFKLAIPAAVTATWPAGTYTYSERVTDGVEVREVGRGAIAVLPDVVTATGGDGRSHAQRALAAIEAALEGRFGDGIQNYSIGGRTVSKIPLTELYALRDKYRIQVFRERNRGRFGSVQISFGGSY